MKALSLAFKAASILSLAGWAVLLGFPFWPRHAGGIVFGLAVGALCALYVYLLFAGRQHDQGIRVRGSFFSLNGIVRLFQSPRIVLAGWVHFLAFDLMVGLYIVTDAARHGMNHWLLLPVLLLTLMFGPAGLLLYLALRYLISADGALIPAI